MDSGTSPPVEGHGAVVAALRRRLATDTGAAVELVQTHISSVLLTDQYAYKLKKPVRLPFVDFSTVEVRRHFCEEELRLNRRLAPTLYLDVVTVTGPPDDPRVGGAGDVIDHAVRMRRFPPGALLGERLAAGTLTAKQLDVLARRLAAFHRTAEVVRWNDAGPDGTDRATDATAQAMKVLDQLEAALGAGPIEPIRAWVASQSALLVGTFASRARDGFVRDCHGDLHLDNAVVLDDDVTAFDCLEFDPALRRTDVIGDVAFLSMDLKARGRPDLAFRFIDSWLAYCGDYAGIKVLRFHEVYRALVRALVAVLRGAGGTTPAGPDYLGCARALVEPPQLQPRLLITHGLSGSGKSTIAAAIVELTGAIRVRSDVERKRLFGLEPLDRSAPAGPDLYTVDGTRRTFERLAACARIALAAGYPVIVDAVFLRRDQRRVFAALAASRCVPYTILDCRAGIGLLRERILSRAAVGGDPSEATVAVLERQLALDEPPEGFEEAAVLAVETEQPTDARAIATQWLSRH